MSTTWFAVLSQTAMKIFTRAHAGEPLQHLLTIENPVADLKGHAQGSRRGMELQNDTPHELWVRAFAHRVATFLDEERRKDHFRELQVAAEQKFLGLVKKELSPETQKLVRAWVKKDLDKVSLPRLTEEFAQARSF